MHPERPTLTFLASAIVVVPFPYHWRTRNVGGVSLIIWLFLSCFIYAIDAAIWIDDAVIRIPVWCDITTKLLVGATMGIPASCLCIAIQLEQIASFKRGLKTNAEQRRDRIIAILICWALPVLYMILHVIFQGHRFDIYEGYGCRPTTYSTLPAALVIYGMPMITSLLTCVYSALALFHFYKHRTMFAKHLSNSNAALSTTVYLRLLMVVIVQMTSGLLVTGASIVLTGKEGLNPWISWEDTHSDFWRIRQFPEVIIDIQGKSQLEAFFWVIPVAAVVFSAFFSFNDEVTKEYRGVVTSFRKVILRMPDSKLSTSTYGTQMSSAAGTNKRHMPVSVSISVTSSSSPSSSNFGGSKTADTTRTMASTLVDPDDSFLSFKKDADDDDVEAGKRASSFWGGINRLSQVSSVDETNSEPTTPTATGTKKTTQ